MCETGPNDESPGAAVARNWPGDRPASGKRLFRLTSGGWAGRGGWPRGTRRAGFIYRNEEIQVLRRQELCAGACLSYDALASRHPDGTIRIHYLV